jgi:hypothetical protein
VTRRAWLAVTAVVLIAAASVWGLRQSGIKDRVMEEFRIAAMIHMGHVFTPGYGYRLLDPTFYTRSAAPVSVDFKPASMSPAEAERFAMRAVVSFITVPLPWKADSPGSLVLMPQQVAWYGLVVLAFAGMVAGWRRDAAFTWVLLGNATLGMMAIALYNGNVGTLVRMRDVVVPVIVWLSALGGCAVLEWAARSLSEGPQRRPDRRPLAPVRPPVIEDDVRDYDRLNMQLGVEGRRHGPA